MEETMADSPATPDLGFSPKGLFIGGTWHESASGKTFESINPSNRESLGDVPYAEERDVDRAVTAAAAAFEDWSRMPVAERSALLEQLADRMMAERATIALLDSVDSGNALKGMAGDVDWSAETYKYFGVLARELKGETSAHYPRHLNFTRRQPYGVVAKINPFNHPFRFCAEKSAAALAAGNTVVVKAAEQAPLSSLKFAEICEAVLDRKSVV